MYPRPAKGAVLQSLGEAVENISMEMCAMAIAHVPTCLHAILLCSHARKTGLVLVGDKRMQYFTNHNLDAVGCRVPGMLIEHQEHMLCAPHMRMCCTVQLYYILRL